MAMIFTQTAGGSGGTNVYCSPRAATSNLLKTISSSVGGTPGAGTSQISLASSETNVSGTSISCGTLPTGTVGDAGTWTVRLNVTTANMNLTLNEIHICHLRSGSSIATIGSVTGLSTSLGSTGVITQNVTGSAVTIVTATDNVSILVSYTNGAMSTQQGFYTVDQNIDSPFNVVAAFIAKPPYRVLQAVNRAASY